MNWNGYFYKKYGAGIYLLLGPLLFDVFYVFFSPLWYESKKNNTATIIEMKTIVSTSKNLDTSCYKIFEALKPLRDLKSTYRSHRTDQLELYRRWKKISKAELEELLPIYIETDHFWKALYRSIDQAFQAMDDDKPYILVIPGSSIGESDNEVVEMINQKVLHSETSMVQAIDLNEVKSGLWLLSHYANRLSRAPDQILTPCQACDFLKSNPNHQVLMVDDCEYSGQQLSSSIRYMNGGEDVNNNVLDIYVALAFRRKKEGTMPNVHMFYEELPSRDIILPHKTPDSMSNSSDITCGHYDSKFTDEITTKYNKGHPFWFEEIYRECEFYSLPTWAKPYDRYFLGDQSDLPYFSEDRQMSHESQYIDFIYWFSLNKNNEQLMKIMDRFLNYLCQNYETQETVYKIIRTPNLSLNQRFHVSMLAKTYRKLAKSDLLSDDQKRHCNDQAKVLEDSWYEAVEYSINLYDKSVDDVDPFARDFKRRRLERLYHLSKDPKRKVQSSRSIWGGLSFFSRSYEHDLNALPCGLLGSLDDSQTRKIDQSGLYMGINDEWLHPNMILNPGLDTKVKIS